MRVSKFGSVVRVPSHVLWGRLVFQDGSVGDSDRMNAQQVRIVVGEGRSSQQGLLRFVLDGEGYDVVADAANPAELARVLATHKPDVVVLDDGIGATAVNMVHEMAPAAKVVLVWPGAVAPIGGAAQVPPSQVLQELGPAVAKVTGVAGATAAVTGAEMVDRAKRDPDALQRTLRGVGESSAAALAAGAIIDASNDAPVVILPVTPSVDDEVVTVPEATGAVAGSAAALAGAAAVGAAGAASARSAPRGAQSLLNRRFGTLALGGAAVAGAIVLALALGGAKVPIAQVSGEAYTYTPPAAPSPSAGTDGTDEPGGPGSWRRRWRSPRGRRHGRGNPGRRERVLGIVRLLSDPAGALFVPAGGLLPSGRRRPWSLARDGRWSGRLRRACPWIASRREGKQGEAAFRQRQQQRQRLGLSAEHPARGYPERNVQAPTRAGPTTGGRARCCLARLRVARRARSRSSQRRARGVPSDPGGCRRRRRDGRHPGAGRHRCDLHL